METNYGPKIRNMSPDDVESSTESKDMISESFKQSQEEKRKIAEEFIEKGYITSYELSNFNPELFEAGNLPIGWQIMSNFAQTSILRDNFIDNKIKNAELDKSERSKIKDKLVKAEFKEEEDKVPPEKRIENKKRTFYNHNLLESSNLNSFFKGVDVLEGMDKYKLPEDIIAEIKILRDKFTGTNKYLNEKYKNTDPSKEDSNMEKSAGAYYRYEMDNEEKYKLAKDVMQLADKILVMIAKEFNSYKEPQK